MNGFINLYKPSGMTSAYALGKLKRKLKGEKCGHMGTLDPLACGILPVAVGKSTRLFDLFMNKTKKYIAEFTFGYQTDTLDSGGKVIFDNGIIPTIEDIEKVIPSQIGIISQMPPIYSAKKVGGKRSYDLARNGIDVELHPKNVEISSIIVSKTQDANKFIFEITCGGGTYIRSIARDIANSLNTYATMTALERVQSGPFLKEQSITLDYLEGDVDIESLIIKPQSILTYPIFEFNSDEYDNFIHGRFCRVEFSDGDYQAFYDGKLICVCHIENNVLQNKVFLKD